MCNRHYFYNIKLFYIKCCVSVSRKKFCVLSILSKLYFIFSKELYGLIFKQTKLLKTICIVKLV